MMFSMGLGLYFNIGFILGLLITTIIIKCKCCSDKRRGKIATYRDGNLFNGLIAVFNTSTLETSVGLVMSLSLFSEGTGFTYACSKVLTIAFGIGFAAWILYTLIFLFVPCPCSRDVKKRLENNAEQLNALYGELDYARHPMI
jgi:uncharacterized membrane protein YciS (DUF1049 family)